MHKVISGGRLLGFSNFYLPCSTDVGSDEIIILQFAGKMGCSRAVLLLVGLAAIAATAASQENWMSFYTRFVVHFTLFHVNTHQHTTCD